MTRTPYICFLFALAFAANSSPHSSQQNAEPIVNIQGFSIYANLDFDHKYFFINVNELVDKIEQSNPINEKHIRNLAYGLLEAKKSLRELMKETKYKKEILSLVSLENINRTNEYLGKTTEITHLNKEVRTKLRNRLLEGMSSEPNNEYSEVSQGQRTGEITSKKQKVASANVSETQGSIMSIQNSTKEGNAGNIDERINTEAIDRLKKLLSGGCSLPLSYSDNKLNSCQPSNTEHENGKKFEERHLDKVDKYSCRLSYFQEQGRTENKKITSNRCQVEQVVAASQSSKSNSLEIKFPIKRTSTYQKASSLVLPSHQTLFEDSLPFNRQDECSCPQSMVPEEQFTCPSSSTDLNGDKAESRVQLIPTSLDIMSPLLQQNGSRAKEKESVLIQEHDQPSELLTYFPLQTGESRLTDFFPENQGINYRTPHPSKSNTLSEKDPVSETDHYDPGHSSLSMSKPNDFCQTTGLISKDNTFSKRSKLSDDSITENNGDFSESLSHDANIFRDEAYLNSLLHSSSPKNSQPDGLFHDYTPSFETCHSNSSIKMRKPSSMKKKMMKLSNEELENNCEALQRFILAPKQFNTYGQRRQPGNSYEENITAPDEELFLLLAEDREPTDSERTESATSSKINFD